MANIKHPPSIETGIGSKIQSTKFESKTKSERITKSQSVQISEYRIQT